MQDLRLLITTQCNFDCEYCCNKLPEVKRQFTYKKLNEIDFSQYHNVCLTGGEPFLRPDLLYGIMAIIPNDIYIYSNGSLISNTDIELLSLIPNFRGLNIGLHSPSLANRISNSVIKFASRIYIQDTKVHLFDVPQNKVKTWVLNQCDNPNENWVVLI